MINKQRVRRIKNVIYAVIVFLFFLPVIIIIALSLKMTTLADAMLAYFERTPPAVSQSSAPQSSDSGYVIPPKNQSTQSALPETSPAQTLPDQALPAQPAPSFPPPDAPAVASSSGPRSSGATVQNTASPAAYPSLYFDTLVEAQAQAAPGTIYLTFDNTPSSQADQILDVLDKHNINATFFVWWGERSDAQNSSFYKEIVTRGHAIGIHSYTSAETFSELYASKDHFLADFSAIFDKICAETGVKTRFYRLPGGSVNPGNSNRQAVLSAIKTDLDARGFIQYDWNASAEDAVFPPLSANRALSNAMTSIAGLDNVVLLMHDGTASTVDALDALIVQCLKQGYTFKVLDYNTIPVSFLK